MKFKKFSLKSVTHLIFLKNKAYALLNIYRKGELFDLYLNQRQLKSLE